MSGSPTVRWYPVMVLMPTNNHDNRTRASRTSDVRSFDPFGDILDVLV